MTQSAAINHYEQVPEIIQGFAAAHKTICESPLDRRLRHLIELRASQINQCAFCVKMHTEEARKDGETVERIERIMVWRHCDDFTEAEKAVLAWTEALTELDPKCDLSGLREALGRHFTKEQISAMTTSVAMINLWNRIQISMH